MGLLQGAKEQLGKLGIYFPRDNCLLTCIVNTIQITNWRKKGETQGLLLLL
jgi:hypothetical protein